MYLVKFGTRSYSGDAFASLCVLRHMNSCRIFHNTHSITYNYFLGKRQGAFIRTGVFIKVDTIKILKIGTPEIITIFVLQLEQLDFTVQYCVQKMQTE